MSMSNPTNHIEIVTSVQRRRRWTASEKVRSRGDQTMQKVPIYRGFLKTAFGSATLSATRLSSTRNRFMAMNIVLIS